MIVGEDPVKDWEEPSIIDMEELHAKIALLRTQTLDIHGYLTDPQVRASAEVFGAMDLHEKIITQGSAVIAAVEKIHTWSVGAKTLDSDMSNMERSELFRLMALLSQIHLSYYKSFKRINDFNSILTSAPKFTVHRLFQESRMCIFQTIQLLK